MNRCEPVPRSRYETRLLLQSRFVQAVVDVAHACQSKHEVRGDEEQSLVGLPAGSIVAAGTVSVVPELQHTGVSVLADTWQIYAKLPFPSRSINNAPASILRRLPAAGLRGSQQSY